MKTCKCGGKLYELYNGGKIVYFCDKCGAVDSK